MTQDNTNNRRSLSQQLLQTLIPIIVGSLSLGWFFLGWRIYQQQKTYFQQRLQNNSFFLSNITDRQLQNNLKILRVFALNPTIIDSAKAATARIDQEKINQLPIEALEARFKQNKTVIPNAKLNNFTLETAQMGNFNELFYTEKNGLNVALSNPTSDVVQSDEEWWQKGKNSDQWISKPEYDESSQSFSIDIIQSIKDPDTNEFLGVIKGVFATQNFESLSQDFVQLNLAASEEIQVVNPQKNNSYLIYALVQEGKAIPETITGGDFLLERAESSLNQNLEESNFFFLKGRFYSLRTIPNTTWVVIASIGVGDLLIPLVQTLFGLFIIFSLLIIIIIIGLRYVARKIALPLQKLADLSDEIAIGNLEYNAVLEGSSEIQQLILSFNHMIKELRAFADSKTQIQNRSAHLLTELNVLTHSIHDIANHGERMEQQVYYVNNKIDENQRALSQTFESFEAIYNGVKSTETTIIELQQSSQNMNYIVDLIQELTEKTHMLALNTSIEASRAGSHGKEFEVIAKEISRLVQQSVAATTEVQTTLKRVQVKIKNVLQSVELSMNQVETGTHLVEETKVTFEQVRQFMMGMNQVVHNIGEITEFQSQTSLTLNQAIQDLKAFI